MSGLARATEPRVWRRFVAIGDSFTEGMCDEDPRSPDRYVGWADRLAVHLAGIAGEHGQQLEYANFAVRGRLLDDIVGPQLQRALALEPDLVSLVGGGNDILANHGHVEGIAERLDAAVERIRTTGADVLLVTPVDPREAPLIRRTRERAAAFAADIWAIANHHRCHVVDQWTFAALRDWRMWHEDRIHMSPEGHRRVALAALDALGHPTDRSDWRDPLPPLPEVPWRHTAAADARWLRIHLAPWLIRRARGRSTFADLGPKSTGLTVIGPAEPHEPSPRHPVIGPG